MITYLGLGSNLGDRRAQLERAVIALESLGVEVQASSSVYLTSPVGVVADQPDFLNACLRARVADTLDPHELLDRVKKLERTLGRQPGGVRHGPRAIDIDLLILGDRTVSSSRLTLPHAGVLERRFVLVPLLELDPELTVGGRRLADALAELEDQRLVLAGPPLL